MPSVCAVDRRRRRRRMRSPDPLWRGAAAVALGRTKSPKRDRNAGSSKWRSAMRDARPRSAHLAGPRRSTLPPPPPDPACGTGAERLISAAHPSIRSPDRADERRRRKITVQKAITATSASIIRTMRWSVRRETGRQLGANQPSRT